MNFGFVIDNRKCIGCHACTVACKSENQVPVGVNRTWVKYIEKGEFPDTRRLFSVMRCNHCEDAPCVEICPVEALHTREDGIVDFDDRRCISCKACTQACPYDALYIDPNTKTAAKCNYCTHRVDIGLEPACVVVCPEHAIISGDMENPETEISQLLARETVSARKTEKGTKPNLFYIDADKASLDGEETAKETDYMWSSQSSGVGKYAKFAENRQNSNASDDQLGISKSSALVQIESRDKKVKRVYDAPSKGVLWGWEVSAYVLTKAISAGAFIIPVAGGMFLDVPVGLQQLGAVISLIFLAITGILLIKDLGRPDRFLYVLLRPQFKSWLSRGAYIITIYGGLLTLWLISSVFRLQNLQKFVAPLAVIFALLTAVYTAFLFAQAKGRDFWQSPMLGIHMLLHSLMAGLAVSLIIDYFFAVDINLVQILVSAMLIAIAVHLITIAIEFLTPHPTEESRNVAENITMGEYSSAFWFGMIFVGNILPGAILLYTNDFVALAVSGMLVLIGLGFAQNIWVRAPQEVNLS